MVRACLERLLPHLDRERVALTGGVAIGFHAPERRRERPTDLDLVAQGMDAVSASVASEFLVSHYHVAQPVVPKAIVQLVDPVSRLRIDIFPDLAGASARAQACSIDGLVLRVLTAEDLLAHKLRHLGSAQPVDEKHWLDAVALAARVGRPAPARPALGKEVYSRDLDGRCERCELSRSAAFPLAPKRAIFDLLGYV